MSRIRLRHGDDEIELEGSDQFIAKQLEAFYERLGTKSAGRPSLKQELLTEAAPPSKSAKKPTPAEFYKSKGRTDGLSKLLIFARYLEEYGGKSDFTPADINELTKQAKLSKDIHTQYYTNGVKQGLLRKHGKRYSLTLSAEEVLATM